MTILPSGTVTFVFTDIEGSTRLLQELGDAYSTVVSDHRRILRAAFAEHGGSEIDTQGDAFFFSFSRARDAVSAAVAAQRALHAHEWPGGHEPRVRMGLHTGEPNVTEEGYLGLDVVRAARIAGAGHGGQILLSETTRSLVGNQVPEGTVVRDLGDHELKDIQHEHIYELSLDTADREIRPLKTDRPRSAGQSLSDRIRAHVEQEIEDAFKKSSERRRDP
jgi:class 3 adenylate cyclase